MDERIDIPDLDSIKDLDTALFLLKHVAKTAESQSKLIETLIATIEELRQQIAKDAESTNQLRQEVAELSRALFGQKSERVVPVDREIKQKKRAEETLEEAEARKAKAKAKRDAKREKRRNETPTEVVHHPVEAEVCEACGASLADAAELADEVTEEYEYVPAHVVRREHKRKRLVCSCGCFAKGNLPPRVVEGGLYGPGLHAHVAVAKCADSLPLDRQARAFKRAGVPLSKSTLCDLFHRDATLLEPLATHVLSRVAASERINADETSIKVQSRKVCRRAFMWDFIAVEDDHTMVAYRFSPDRSGQTPIEVLGETTGVLQVDGYTGYNQVTTPKGRKRAGCWAHARRKFFAALETSPEEAQHAIDLIRDIYEVEWDAAHENILGTEKHGALRRLRSRNAVDELMSWAEAQKPKHRPKSPLGVALKYLINQRETLERFIEDVKIRPDNNIAEQHLRLIALGRKNFLFVGNNQAGRNLATLQTIVSTCIANGVNPQAYLTDILLRIQDHPQSRIDELMPWNWRPPPRTQ